MKRRIIRSDQYNWSIQEWQEGGETIARGRFAGQKTQAKWRIPEKHYPSLADAARAFLRDTVDDSVSIGEPGITDIVRMLAAIEAAEEQTKRYIASLLESQRDDVFIGLLQERGYTVTNGKKGRSSYVEDDVEAEATPEV